MLLRVGGGMGASSPVMLWVSLSTGHISELLKPHRVCLVTPVLLSSPTHTCHRFLVRDSPQWGGGGGALVHVGVILKSFCPPVMTRTLSRLLCFRL